MIRQHAPPRVILREPFGSGRELRGWGARSMTENKWLLWNQSLLLEGMYIWMAAHGREGSLNRAYNSTALPTRRSPMKQSWQYRAVAYSPSHRQNRRMIRAQRLRTGDLHRVVLYPSLGGIKREPGVGETLAPDFGHPREAPLLGLRVPKQNSSRSAPG